MYCKNEFCKYCTNKSCTKGEILVGKYGICQSMQVENNEHLQKVKNFIKFIGQ